MARAFVLRGDRMAYDRKMIVPCRSIVGLVDPVTDPDSRWWPWVFQQQYPFCVTPVAEVRRGEVLARIAKGGLGIEDRLGVWGGQFWTGLRTAGALRRGPGTEFYLWERGHPALVADLAEMPVFGRLEPAVSKSGLRRLRRCYAAYLPPDDPAGPSVVAGLFAGAALTVIDGAAWVSLPDDAAVRAVLAEWAIPVASRLMKGRHRLLVSPFFAALFAHLMPTRSAQRILAVRTPAGCPFLPVVFWERVLACKGQRYMPFPNALPWGTSKATFFRRGWRRRDLHRLSAVGMGITTISPRLREVIVEWYERRTVERLGHEYDPATHPVPPGIGIPAQRLPPVAPRLPPPAVGRCGCLERRRR